MRLLVFALVFVIPLVMGGMPSDMEDLFRHVMEQAGGMSGGDSHSGEDKGGKSDMSGDHSGGKSFDMDEMLKMMMKKDKMSESKDSDDDDDSGDKDKHSWGVDKGWHEESDEDDEYGDKDSSDSHESGDSDKKEEYEKFKKWMEKKKKEMKEDKKEEEMKKKIMEFKAYKKMKEHKEAEMEEHKMALYKQMKMIKEKKMMTEHLYEVSKDFMKRKRAFTFDVLSRFMGLCGCEDSMGLFKKIKEGRFGFDDDDDDDSGDKDGDMGDGGMPKGGDHSDDDKGDDKGEMDFHKPSREEMHEYVMKFLYMSHEERLKHVVGDVVKVMCGSAKQYFYHMKQIEHYLIEFRKAMYGKGH